MKFDSLRVDQQVRDRQYPEVIGTVRRIGRNQALIFFTGGSSISGAGWWDKQHIEEFLQPLPTNQPVSTFGLTVPQLRDLFERESGTSATREEVELLIQNNSFDLDCKTDLRSRRFWLQLIDKVRDKHRRWKEKQSQEAQQRETPARV